MRAAFCSISELMRPVVINILVSGQTLFIRHSPAILSSVLCLPISSATRTIFSPSLNAEVWTPPVSRYNSWDSNKHLHEMTDRLRLDPGLVAVKRNIHACQRVHRGDAAGAAGCPPPGLRLFHAAVQPDIHIIAMFADAHILHFLHGFDECLRCKGSRPTSLPD